MPVRLLYSVGSVPFGYPRCLRRPTALDILRYPMPVLSISCRLLSWVMGISSVSVSVSVSVTVASSRSYVDRCVRFPRATVSCLRFLVSRLWPAASRVLVINRVMLVCSGTFGLWLHASGSAPVRARLFSVPRCHCFVTVSQRLAVCLSCRVSHCCRFVLSATVLVSTSSLAAARLICCVVRAVTSLSVCRFWFDCGPLLGRSLSFLGGFSSARASLYRVAATMW